MTWNRPRFAKAAFDIAGAALVSDAHEDLDTLEIVEHWRAVRAYPLDAFGRELTALASTLGVPFIGARRLKRLPSIERKLRLPRPMRLTQIQDIAGCRIVVDDDTALRRLADLCDRAPWRHTLTSVKDYAAGPKADGYRGIHRVFRFASDDAQAACYDGMRIEVQLRTASQHRWATAVESVDVALGYDLKFGGRPAAWRRFFALAATLVALRDGRAPTPGAPAFEDDAEAELRELEHRLDARATLRASVHALDAAAVSITMRRRDGAATYDQRDLGDARYLLLALDPQTRRLDVAGYETGDVELALRAYEAMERDVASAGSKTMVALVSLDESPLRDAYPNYLLDTTAFAAELEQLLDRAS